MLHFTRGQDVRRTKKHNVCLSDTNPTHEGTLASSSVLFCSLWRVGGCSLFPDLGRVINSPESTTSLSGPSWWEQLRKSGWGLPSSCEFPGGGVSLLMSSILGQIPPGPLAVHHPTHTSEHSWFHLHFLLKTLLWVSVFRIQFTHLSLLSKISPFLTFPPF